MSNRLPDELNEDWLRLQARRHIERYWPSVDQLRRVLRRRVDRYQRERGGSHKPGYAMTERILADLTTRGVLDDARFTRSWVDQLHRRGDSRHRIRAKLRQKGVKGEVVDEALAALDAAERAQGVDPVLARAAATLRRRRLGPYRFDPERRRDRREKDLAALARAGFPYGVCKQLIDAEDIEEVELLASGAPA